MLILWKARQKDPSRGYATTFLQQLEEVLANCLDRGTRIVVNAGGLNPAGLANTSAALAERLGFKLNIAYIQGDDLLSALEDGDQLIEGFLGRGVSSSTRSDPQAKALGDYLPARYVSIPETLMGTAQ